MRNHTKDSQLDLVSVGVESVSNTSGGKVTKVTDLYRRDLHPNRLFYKSYDEAASEVGARNNAIDSKKIFKAWISKTEI